MFSYSGDQYTVIGYLCSLPYNNAYFIQIRTLKNSFRSKKESLNVFKRVLQLGWGEMQYGTCKTINSECEKKNFTSMKRRSNEG